MVNVVLDKSGRVVLPKEIREKFGTNVFEITLEENKIILKPKEGLLSWYGKVPQIDVEGFRKEKKKEIGREPVI
ncbi:AbrB/MazE/SpoVT family DNA-binding domain-containing protein [Candidatus Micrarchaeota archaeon]|nr:AbrB/MazE/SpoVT family DNA-binding domain-containing protein [Candidatus Micrarchaeota archaeon]